jgi:hydrogenase maturation protease
VADESTKGRRIVVGVGNPHRGDDAAGRAVARALRDTLPADVEIVEHDGEAAALIDCLERVDEAYLIDACSSGAPAGTRRRLDVAHARLPPERFASTHGVGLAQAIELARALDVLPRRCIVYAIEGATFDVGAPLSAAVAAAVAATANDLRTDLVGAGRGDGG